jgi:hypothetical protein
VVKATMTKHHAEWLSLIDISGPFLSVPALERVFPHGLDAHDPDHTRLVKVAFEEWENNQQGDRPSPAIHREWINFVLKQTLGLPDEVLAEGQAIPQTLQATIAEHGETLRPDIVVRNPDGVPSPEKPRLLVQTYPPTQELEKPVYGRHWKASPATRMMELLHATDTRLVLVTNGNDTPKRLRRAFMRRRAGGKRAGSGDWSPQRRSPSFLDARQSLRRTGLASSLAKTTMSPSQPTWVKGGG